MQDEQEPSGEYAEFAGHNITNFLNSGQMTDSNGMNSENLWQKACYSLLARFSSSFSSSVRASIPF